jgi:hypothetical protein
VNTLHRRREIAWPTLSDRWDEEGRAPVVSCPLPYEPSDSLDVERRVLECLGAALVSDWNDMPTDVQRSLFAHAASGKSYAAAVLKGRIARFLHNHKEDWAARFNARSRRKTRGDNPGGSGRARRGLPTRPLGFSGRNLRTMRREPSCSTRSCHLIATDYNIGQSRTLTQVGASPRIGIYSGAVRRRLSRFRSYPAD